MTEPETSTQLPVPVGRPSPGIVGASLAMLGVHKASLYRAMTRLSLSREALERTETP